MTWKPLKDADGKGGIRYREHPIRKHGAVPDRYYAVVYWWQGKTVSEGIGWASEKWTPTKCFGLLAQIKQNQATGQGPCTLRELRTLSDIERAARQQKVEQQDVSIAAAWDAYISARKVKWSERHLADHLELAKPGGEMTKRGNGKIKAGPLAQLMPLKLSELTPEKVGSWAEKEVVKRGARTRLAFSLLRAFLNWCTGHPKYKSLVSADACANRVRREIFPKKRAKDDCLQKEQLKVWFAAVRGLSNPVVSAYLQVLLLTGARREELARLKWEDLDFKWQAITLHDKVEIERTIPLPPYCASLLALLPQRNAYVFFSPTAASGRLQEPRHPHNRAIAVAGIEGLTIHGLRRSFATLSEWIEMPAGIVAQIMGHKPSATAEKHYRRRPLDLLRMWHVKIEAWIMEQAGIEQPTEGRTDLKVVKGGATHE